MPHLFRLPQPLLDELLARAGAAPGREVCGLLAGPPGEPPARHYPVTNTAERADRFDMDAAELIDAFRCMRQAGEELLAIYHSHPFGPPTPSATDIAECQYPEAVHLILGWRDGALAARAYGIGAGKAKELTLVPT